MGTYRAVLVINGEKVQEREVRLALGEARIATFTVVGNTNDIYTIKVDKLTRREVFKVLTPAALTHFARSSPLQLTAANRRASR